VPTSPRRLWVLAEPLHALTYFAPESQEAFAAAGLRGFWRGYFAGRAAPLGPASAGLVTATFFGFQPEFVARAVPSVWSTVAPPEAVTARLAGIDAALRRLLGPGLPGAHARAAAEEVRAAVDRAPVAGRPLFGANAALEWPAEPHLDLWHAATLLREHRGDGHVSVLTAAGIDPTTAHVLRCAADGIPLDSIRAYRGWTDEDWAAAARVVRDRGWIDDAGRVTRDGARVRDGIEHDTDRLAAELVDRIADLETVTTAFTAVAAAIERTAAIPYPNPIGVPRP
jgi:Helix-turn-helix family